MSLIAADEEQLLCLEALGCALIAAERRGASLVRAVRKTPAAPE